MWSLLYIIFAFFSTWFLPGDWYLVKSIIGLPVIILFPILVGELVGDPLFPYLRRTSLAVKNVFFWSIGVLVLLISLYVAAALSIFHFQAILLFWTALVVFRYILLVFRDKKISFVQSGPGLSKYLIISCLVIIVIGSLNVLYIRSYSPFPLQSGGDNIFLGGLASEIMNNDFSNSNFSVYSYLPVIPLTLAFSSTIAHVEPIHVLWFSPFLLYIVFGLGLYLFLVQKTKRPIISLMVAVLFLFIVGDRGRVIDLFDFRAKNLVYIILPYTLLIIDRCFHESSWKINRGFITSISIVIPALIVAAAVLILQTSFYYIFLYILLLLFAYLFIRKRIDFDFLPLAIILGVILPCLHSYSGFFASLIVGLLVLGMGYSGRFFSYLNRIFLYLYIGFFLYVLIFQNKLPSIFGWLPSFNNVVLGGQYNYTPSIKIGIFLSSLTVPVIFIALLGILKLTEGHRKALLPYFYALLLISVFFLLPINFGYRLLEVIVPFLALFVAIFLVTLEGRSYYLNHSYASKLFLSFLWVLLLFKMVFSPVDYINWIFSENIADRTIGITNFTRAEYEAASWVKDNYPTNTLIFTTPELTRSFTAISEKTIMLRSQVDEYGYVVSYNSPAHPKRCRSVEVNGYLINQSNILERNSSRSFSINTVDKTYMSTAKNVLRIENCTVEEVPMINVRFGRELDVPAVESDGGLLFSFDDQPIARKEYGVAIFDNVSDLRELRRQLFSELDAKKAHNIAMALTAYYTKGQDKKAQMNFSEMRALIVVSGAAAKWSTDDLVIHNMAVPFQYFDGFEKFNDSQYFTKVFSIPDEVYVFEVNV